MLGIEPPWEVTAPRSMLMWKKPGGTFLLFEGHPLDFLWEEESSTFVLRDGATYFTGKPLPELGFPHGAALRYDPRSR